MWSAVPAVRAACRSTLLWGILGPSIFESDAMTTLFFFVIRLMKRISTGSDAKILIPERIRIVAMLLYGRSSIPITVSVGPCQYCAPPRLRDELDSKEEEDSVRGGRISELKARPDLNGSYAVILPPEDEDEHRRLEEQERVKVSGYPKPLA